MTGPGPDAPAGLVVALLAERGHTVAVAESLTGGLLAASLVAVPGASAVFRGGIVAYATDLKSALLDVPAALLERHGAVHADVAGAMADGVRRRLSATFGVATTGAVLGTQPKPAETGTSRGRTGSLGRPGKRMMGVMIQTMSPPIGR